MTRGISILMLGIVLLLAAWAASWAQDAAAPWLNVGEARIGSTVTFTSGGGDYRIVTSGVSRPKVDATACTIVTATEERLRRLGGQGANAVDHLGVSRVIGFAAPAGRTTVACEDRFLASAPHGRFQIVDADGPLSIAIIAAVVLGLLLLVLGGLLIIRGASRRSS